MAGQAAQRVADRDQVARGGMAGDDPVDQALQVGQRAQGGAQLGAQQALLEQVGDPVLALARWLPGPAAAC